MKNFLVMERKARGRLSYPLGLALVYQVREYQVLITCFNFEVIVEEMLVSCMVLLLCYMLFSIVL